MTSEKSWRSIGRRRRFASCLVVTLVVMMVHGARAEPPPGNEPLARAREHVRQGHQFYEEEAYEAAQAEFLRAYDATKSYKVLYNIALVAGQLNDFAGALRAYTRYLQEGGDELPAGRREEITKAISLFERRVVKLEIVPNVAGAQITVDDRPMGEAPLSAPIVLNPGEHKLGALAANHRAAFKHLVFAAGESARVSLTLAPEREPSAPVALPPSSRSTFTAAWPYWVPAVILGAGTVTAGLLTLSAEDKLATMRRSPVGAEHRDALDEQRSRTESLALITDVLGATTAVAVGAAVYFTIRASRAEKRISRVLRLDGVGAGWSSVVVNGAF